MRVLVMIKGRPEDEAKAEPTPAMFEAMNAYNQQLVEAGVMLGGDGLRPSSDGAQVVFEGGRTSVVDGPFTEAKEIIAGYWIWEVRSLEEALEWARRCPTDPDGTWQALEVRPYYETEDFADVLTPELREQEQRLSEQIRAQHGDAR